MSKGKFLTRLSTDDCDEPGHWVLTAPLIWEGIEHTIVVPTGFVTDLASVPKIFRNLLDVTGRSRRPAALHDYLYSTKPFTREVCDKLFRDALVEQGERLAWVYYHGVRIGGWVRWNQED